MKKLLILTIAMFSLLSCSSNEDTDSLLGGNSNGGDDPIIGKWQVVSTTENGDNILTECEKNTTVTFSNDGTVTVVDFYNEFDPFSNIETCESETGIGTWINTGNSEYSIGGDESQKIVFSQNNTKWSTTTEDGNYTTIETYKKI